MFLFFVLKYGEDQNHVRQGFSIIFSCGPQSTKDSSKIDVWGPNDHHCSMYFYVYWSWQRAKQLGSAGRIWPTGCHLRRPDVREDRQNLNWFMVITSAVVDTTFVDIYVDTKNIPTCRYNIQHIDKRTMENKMSIIMWEAAMSYATTFK